MNCVPQNQECPHHFLDGANNGSSPFRDVSDAGNRPFRGDTDDDDNPFSRGRPDGGHDLDLNETRRVLNDTRLRRRLHRSFNPSFIDEIIGLQRHENGSLGNKDHQHGDACSRRYSSCVKNALSNLLFLSDLDDKCCKMAQDPQLFAQRLRNISRQFNHGRMDCPRGTKFCPFSFVLKGNGCIPVGGNISAGLKNNTDDGILTDAHSTPWGNQSQKGYKVCEVLMGSIRDEKPCSHRRLLRWLKNKNDSISPFGKPCPKDTKFCPSSLDCRTEAESCRTEKLTHWASKNLCNSSERLCLGCDIHCRLKDDKCLREANMSRDLREAALTLQPGKMFFCVLSLL